MESVQYQEKYRDEIIRMLGESAQGDYIHWKKDIWEWQFIENPFTEKISPFVLFIEEEQVAGFNGSMPVLLKYNEKTMPVIWSCDTVIKKTFRGKGYGKKVIEGIESKSPVVLGFGISDAAAPIFRKRGWRVNQEVEEYYYQNRINNPKSLVKKVLQAYNTVKSYRDRHHTSEYKASIIDALEAPEEMDRLWERVEKGYQKIITRDRSYVLWKYGKHPLSRYKIILVRNRQGELAAACVFRPNKDKSRLVDYIGPPRNIGIKEFIVKEFIKECSHSILLNCISTDEEFKRVFDYLGFARYKERPRFYVFSLLQDDPEPEKGWFIMSGDSDEDLLEAAQEGYKEKSAHP